jgi:hypothetical protein
MATRMSRGEMIRRLDQASMQVHDRNGPLTPDERAIAGGDAGAPPSARRSRS